MRVFPILSALAVVALLSPSAMAGNLSVTDGKTQWQSTNCTEPSQPEPITRSYGESGAEYLNSKTESFNVYSHQMQNYMNCVSKEAETDSNATNQAISGTAQVMIDAAQQKVNALHDTLRSKHHSKQ